MKPETTDIIARLRELENEVSILNDAGCDTRGALMFLIESARNVHDNWPMKERYEEFMRAIEIAKGAHGRTVGVFRCPVEEA